MKVIIDLDYLIDFLNELRALGFDVSTQQYIAAQNLLIALAAGGQLPDDPHALRTLLAPIVCSSPREQDSFYRYFDHWIKRNPKATLAAQTAGEVIPASVNEPRPRWTRVFRNPIYWAVSIFVAAAAAFFCPNWFSSSAQVSRW